MVILNTPELMVTNSVISVFSQVCAHCPEQVMSKSHLHRTLPEPAFPVQTKTKHAQAVLARAGEMLSAESAGFSSGRIVFSLF